MTHTDPVHPTCRYCPKADVVVAKDGTDLRFRLCRHHADYYIVHRAAEFSHVGGEFTPVVRTEYGPCPACGRLVGHNGAAAHTYGPGGDSRNVCPLADRHHVPR